MSKLSKDEKHFEKKTDCIYTAAHLTWSRGTTVAQHCYRTAMT